MSKKRQSNLSNNPLCMYVCMVNHFIATESLLAKLIPGFQTYECMEISFLTEYPPSQCTPRSDKSVGVKKSHICHLVSHLESVGTQPTGPIV